MPIGDLLAEITGEPSPTHPQTMSLPKRKADDSLRKPEKKFASPSANTSRPIAKPSVESMAKMNISDKKPTFASPRAAFNNGQPTPPLADAPKAPPKKGSFAEIMARGKANHSTMGQIGKIQHKKIEKAPSKREREEMKNQKSSNLQKNLAPGSKFQKMGRPLPVKPLPADSRKKNPAEPEKKIKKAATATTGYAGTARPKPGGTKGTSRLSASASNRGRDDRRSTSAPRYAYVSEEEEEEEEEEDEPDYASDASSDMEAAAFEVDEEEELAARIARREDAEALAEENKLKREKEAKRKKLAAMAKKAKPERY